MKTVTLILIAFTIVIFVVGVFFPRKDNKKVLAKEDLAKNQDKKEDADNLKVISYKIIVPLRVQACERLLLFIERIRLSVLVKRLFHPGISRDDFQFSLMQNVHDEFEHNLAQRLYVTEDTWNLVNLAKEETLQFINTVFAENQDADIAVVAAILSSMQSQIAESAVMNIKREFDTFLI
ncbi:MAG: hypothetical protein MJZ78_05850 [Bacteroidales bacterium]|nr:hypothetical protein [Bacteroidales bacterium]